MKSLGIIGGTGLSSFNGFETIQKHSDLNSELGRPSCDVVEGVLGEVRVLFLPRHGEHHSLAPHKINYRANLLVLQQLGVDEIIAVNAVGGIAQKAKAGHISVPDQIIDYTSGRENTFFDGDFKTAHHIDFSYPYKQEIRLKLISILSRKTLIHGFSDTGVYAATQGPRLESIAEIQRLEQDGCDLVGMTGMPEAALARELGIPYASLCLVVNRAAGKSDQLITLEDIRSVIASGMIDVQSVIADYCNYL
jgi:5'-methylthioinosine phosphorylase